MKKLLFLLVMVALFLPAVGRAQEFDVNELVRVVGDALRDGIRAQSDIAREKERTRQEMIQSQSDTDRENIREKRDVTVTAIERGGQKNIQYTRGGETIGVDIQAQKLQRENEKMRQELAQIRRELNELKNK